MTDARSAKMSGHVFIGASLDGFIARGDGDIAWLTRYASEDYGYNPFIDAMDGIVMGRGSYEKVATFDPWPYPKPVVVLSKALRDTELRADLIGKVRISRLSPAETMEDLRRKGWRRAYIDGGKVIQSFLREGLIADLVVTWIPILLGGGIPLFGPLEKDVTLRHVGTTSYPSGLVQSKYEVS